MIDDVISKLAGEPAGLFTVNSTTAVLLFGLVGLLAAREILFGSERNTSETLLRLERPLDLVIAPLAALFLMVFISYAISSSA